MKNKKIKGFSLVELLVVFSIIGLLMSVVLVNLNISRNKAKDAAIKTNVGQIVRLMALNYADFNGYANLQALWDSSPAECAVGFAGTYAGEMRKLCDHITTIITTSPSGDLHTGVQVGGTNNFFSVMVYLPFADRYYCVGSGGGTSIILNGGWNDPAGPANYGCWQNP